MTTKNETIKNLNAYDCAYDAWRKHGYTIPNAIRKAQEAQTRINKRASEPLDSKNRASWPIFPRSLFYNPVNKNGERWVENTNEGLRFAGKAHELIRLNHTGWYCDSFQGELAIGAVYQLPARNGVAQYFPAVLDPCNEGCALIDFSQPEKTKESAACRADSMAESYAEDAREYEAKDRAEQETLELKEEIQNIRQTITSACREARELRDSEICEKAKNLIAIGRQKINELLRDKNRKQERISALADNFWLAVE